MARIPRRELLAWVVAGGALALAAVGNRERAGAVEERSMANRALAGAFAERDVCARRLQRRLEGEELERQVFDLLGRPDTRQYPLEPVGGTPLRAAVIVNQGERRAFVLASVMPATDDEVLEVWVVRGDEPPQSAGRVNRSGDAVGIAALAPGKLDPPPDRILVALAPHGGSVTPDRVVLRGRLR